MMRQQRHGAVRLLCHALAVSQLLLPVAGCSDEIRGQRGAPSGSLVSGVLGQINLGEKVFEIVRGRLALSPERPQEKVAALDRNRAEFVAAVNTIVTVDAVANIGPTARVLFELVDDDTIPLMAGDVATVLELLRADPAAMQALAELTGTRKVAQTGDVMDFAGRLVNYPEIEDLLVACAAMVRENDGRDDLGNPNGEPTIIPDLLRFASVSLQALPVTAPGAGTAPGTGTVAPASTSTAGSTSGTGTSEIAVELLREANLRGQVVTGAPEWIVLVDLHGNPMVATDSATGTVFRPFVDRDSDGAADVDAAGRPIDGSGLPISIAPFGQGANRDADGRALAVGGTPIYDYVDVKRTLLALFLAIGGELIQRNAHQQIVDWLIVALGPRVLDDAGTPLDASDDFMRFDEPSPVADLAHGALEIAKYEQAPKLLSAAAELLRSDPARAEALLVHLGKALDLLRQRSAAAAPAPAPAPGQPPLIDDLLPLIDQICEARPSGGRSTARILLDTLHRVSRAARDLPPQMAPLFRFNAVERETVADQDRNTIDEARSVPVDHSRPAVFVDAFGRTVDNRTVIHRLLDLLTRANGCSFFGKTLAVFILETIADLTPATVAALTSMISSIPGFIPNLVCNGIAADLSALDGLARSGALDALIPITKAFKDQGEIPLLVQILVRLQGRWGTLMRPFERDTADILETGAIEEALDVLGIATTLTVPGTGENVADVLADAIANLVDDDRAVLDRGGRRVGTLLHLLLLPVRNMDARAAAAGQSSASLQSVLTTVVDLVAERVTNDNGTPFDPSDDFEQLRNRSLVPFAARLIEITANRLPRDAAVRASDLSDAQAEATAFVFSRALPALVDLERTVLRSPSKQAIVRAVVNLLTPRPTAAPRDDVFAALLKVVASFLQTPVDSGSANVLLRFAGRVIDPDRGIVTRLVAGFEQLLTRDQGQTVINLLRNALNAPAPGQPPPLSVLLRVFDDVRAAGAAPGSSASGGGATLAELDAALAQAIDFIRDQQAGLGSIFAFIRNRPR